MHTDHGFFRFLANDGPNLKLRTCKVNFSQLLYSWESLNGGTSEILEGVYYQLAESTTRCPFYSYNLSRVFLIEGSLYREGEKLLRSGTCLDGIKGVADIHLYPCSPQKEWYFIHSQHIGRED